MRLIAWNMNHWQSRADQREAAWRFLESQEPTVALLQETHPPVQHADAVYEPGSTGRWGTAVLAPGLPIQAVASMQLGSKTFELRRSHPGSVAVAEVHVPSVGAVTCVSIYGTLDDQGWARTTMHRSLSDLSPLLHARRNGLLVMGGDLNLSTQLPRPYRYYDRNLFQRIELFGLVDLLGKTASARQVLPDCPCEDEPCRHVQTQQPRSGQVPWHNDYLYATPKLAERLTSCQVVDAGNPPWSLSDHRLVVADFA